MRFTVVAEIGVNFQNYEEAKEMIRLASYAGASHVKFQAYGEKDLEGLPRDVADHLRRIMLTVETAKELKKYADGAHMIWFATPTSVEKVDMLEEVGVSLYKIREKDSRNYPLIKKIIDLGKTVFISTQKLPLDYDLLYNPRVIWLYCLPKYPPHLEELCLREKLATGFHGYSNHFPDIVVPFYAACLGATVIECHVTLDHSRPDVDAKVSIDFEELKRLCDMLRTVSDIQSGERVMDSVGLG